MSKHRYTFTVEDHLDTKWIGAAKLDEDGHWQSRTGISIPESEIPALIEFLQEYVDNQADPVSHTCNACGDYFDTVRGYVFHNCGETVGE